MTVTVILDTSSILAYTKGSIAVGELLSIVTDDGDTAVIPATCLAEAHRRLGAGADELLRVLTTVPCVAVTPLLPDQVAEVGATSRGLAGIDIGHAAIEAIDHDAQLATQDAALMSRLLPPDWPIIDL